MILSDTLEAIVKDRSLEEVFFDIYDKTVGENR